MPMYGRITSGGGETDAYCDRQRQRTEYLIGYQLLVISYQG